MHGVSTEKVPGGKLLRVKVDYSATIKRVSITGDFFLHPEEAIEKIELSLKGLNANESEQSIAGIIKEVATRHDIDMIGVDPEAIARNVKKAIHEGEASV